MGKRLVREPRRDVITTSHDTPEHHNHMWALLSITGFLVLYLVAIVWGEQGLMPFFYGSMAMLCILLIEALLRGKMWLFEPQFNHAITRKDMPLRLALFVGCFVFVLESLLTVGVATNPLFARRIGSYLVQQSCDRIGDCM